MKMSELQNFGQKYTDIVHRPFLAQDILKVSKLPEFWPEAMSLDARTRNTKIEPLESRRGLEVNFKS